MANKIIFEISMKLVDSLELIKSKVNNKKYDLASIRNLFEEFNKVLTQHTNDSVLNSNHYIELIQFKNNLDELINEEHINKAITDIHRILVSLQIKAPKLVFLLTAPFDEEAKTGDGQYADSLVYGFKNYDKNTTCIWLKEQEGHYKLPIHAEIAPIPKNTIPSVYALQPVANGHTVLCGYQMLNDNTLETAKKLIENKITLRTPQIITDKDNNLVLIGYQRNKFKHIFDKNEAINDIEKINELLVIEKENLISFQENCLKLQNKKSILDQLTTYKEELIQIVNNKNEVCDEVNDQLTKINDYINQNKIITPQNKDKRIGISAPDSVKKLNALIKTVGQDLKEADSKIQLTQSKIQEHEETLILLKALVNQFQPASFKEKELIKILNALSGFSDNCYDFINKTIKRQEGSTPRTSSAFYDALEVAIQDDDRKSIIDQLIVTMKKNSMGEPCHIDIHIRPPDTGAFIMPDDIEKFKQANIRVNITVHEYKQNYTRRHLQKMTHDLLSKADSVLFFNEKDKNNAIKASVCGDLDYKHKELKNWPIEAYGLQNKAGLTVASQILSGEPESPQLIIQKDPNILSFGTIRPGKGFEEAFTIAKEIKQQEKSIQGKCPTVIIAGDPQYTELMEEMFKNRYGDEAFRVYKQKNPYEFSKNPSQNKRDYWNKAKSCLEENFIKNGLPFVNPYLDIHPWCTSSELNALKNKSKYVCRMDDMGMRNNGSAIISVLDVGIVYTKWGCVTDNEYYPEGKYPKGMYGSAVDLGSRKYGLHHDKATNKLNNKEKIESDYKRKSNARDPVNDIFQSILERERDQKVHEQGDITQSKNYRTVVEAQTLLSTKFTLQNSIRNLQKVFIQESANSPVLASPHKEEFIKQEIMSKDEVSIANDEIMNKSKINLQKKIIQAHHKSKNRLSFFKQELGDIALKALNNSVSVEENKTNEVIVENTVDNVIK